MRWPEGDAPGAGLNQPPRLSLKRASPTGTTSLSLLPHPLLPKQYLFCFLPQLDLPCPLASRRF